MFLRLPLRGCVTASHRCFHRGEQVTLRSSLRICHQVIVEADYVMREFSIEFHFCLGENDNSAEAVAPAPRRPFGAEQRNYFHVTLV